MPSLFIESCLQITQHIRYLRRRREDCLDVVPEDLYESRSGDGERDKSDNCRREGDGSEGGLGRDRDTHNTVAQLASLAMNPAVHGIEGDVKQLPSTVS